MITRQTPRALKPIALAVALVGAAASAAEAGLDRHHTCVISDDGALRCWGSSPWWPALRTWLCSTLSRRALALTLHQQ